MAAPGVYAGFWNTLILHGCQTPTILISSFAAILEYVDLTRVSNLGKDDFVDGDVLEYVDFTRVSNLRCAVEMAVKFWNTLILHGCQTTDGAVINERTKRYGIYLYFV